MQTAAQPTSDSAKAAYIIEKFDQLYNFHNDGTWEQTVTGIIRVQSQAGIQQVGDLPLPYESAYQKAEIVYVRVRKKDGTVITTPPSNIQDVPAPITLQAPMYTDLRMKQIPVRNLDPGDTLEFEFHETEETPQIPGQFWLSENFLEEGTVSEQKIEVRLPAGKYVQVVSSTVQPSIRHDGNQVVYTWLTSHKPKDTNADQPEEHTPDIQLTTFHSWAELGEWYRSLQASQMAVTPAIAKQAQQIIAGLKTDDARQRAIYTYVATRFRYIGLSFGLGRFQPHMADTVLDNRFGDCKDKHTLFAALMKAAGYDVWPALIGAGHKLDARVPSPAQFNHVISVLPQGKEFVWLDTTEEVAPFGMLMSTLRDKQALVIPIQGTPELKTTPENPPFPDTTNFLMTGTLSQDAVLTGHASIETRGDMELLLRAAFHAAPQENWQKVGQAISYMLGFAGEISHLDVSDPDDTTNPFHLQYDYTRKDYGGGNHEWITPPLPPVFFLKTEMDKKPEDTIPLGAPGTRNFRAVVSLPQGDTAVLPEDKTVETDFAAYKETSSVKDGKLTAERVYRVKQAKIPAARWNEYLKFVKAVQNREDLQIHLTTSTANTPAQEERDSSETRDLINRADKAAMNGEFSEAEDLLQKAKAIDSTAWGLMATYGDLYYKKNQMDQAIRAYRQEMANHPDNSRCAEWLAHLLLANKRPDEAAAVVESLLSRKPDDPKLLAILADVRLLQKRTDDAKALLQRIAAQPDLSPEMLIWVGNLELAMGNRQDAFAALEKAMRTGKSPMTVNDAAYFLIDKNMDLDEARPYVETALQQTEAETGGPGGEADPSDSHAAAIWDTVGWLSFRKGNYTDAERYIQAAWMISGHALVASHLGRTYDKLGKHAEAMQMYQLAVATGQYGAPAKNDPAMDQTVKWKATSTVDPIHNEALVPLPHPLPRSVSAQVTLHLNAPRDVEATFVSGDPELKSQLNLLKQVDYSFFFPDKGPEKLLRQATLLCAAGSPNCQLHIARNQ